MSRRPAVAGMFYPADPGALRSQVAGFLAEAGGAPDSSVAGLVCPHAGYVYSGRTAGRAWAMAPEGIRTVVIISPCHRVPVSGASVFAGDAYETPLGQARIDSFVVSGLQTRGFGYEPSAHAWEHAEEVQVPFVQVRWPEARIVPIVQGTVTSAFSARLAQALQEVAPPDGGDILVVASSDLSHYHPIETAEEMDRRFIEAFEARDPSMIESLVRSGRAEACGAGPVMTLLHWAASDDGMFGTELVAYDTSASTSGDSMAVVGYMAGVVRRS